MIPRSIFAASLMLALGTVRVAAFLTPPGTGAIRYFEKGISAVRPQDATALEAASSSLRYTNDSDATDVVSSTSKHRMKIKKELALAAITNYDNAGKPGEAEDLMKQLETMRPLDRPAHDPSLNARWSFVFTGVPTIGMKLITLLSRISVGFPVVDFRDVFLEVFDNQSMVKAIVSARFFGVPVELNVFTSLSPDPDCPHGTMMFEHFEGIRVAGIPVPTPESWHRTRNLEVSYLDEDMMIARTAGGEPHFLLRHSRCSTDDDACDIDSDEELTRYFVEAREMYGEKFARCLVDRDYGKASNDNNCDCEPQTPLQNVLSLNPSDLISFGKKSKDGK